MLYKRCVPTAIISVFIHKNNITQTDDHQSTCELFDFARMIQTKKRSPTGFDKGPFILSLKRTTKTICKALKIISLQFLILSCQVVTKKHKVKIS